ncbi:MAG: hypothetical protein ACTHJQ_25505 [Rhizobiaceae bacterium]
MTEIRIRVTLNGKEPRRELMVENMKIADVSRDDTADMIRDALEAVCAGKTWVPVQGLTASRAETIEFGMQAFSSLRWG